MAKVESLREEFYKFFSTQFISPNLEDIYTWYEDKIDTIYKNSHQELQDENKKLREVLGHRDAKIKALTKLIEGIETKKVAKNSQLAQGNRDLKKSNDSLTYQNTCLTRDIELLKKEIRARKLGAREYPFNASIEIFPKDTENLGCIQNKVIVTIADRRWEIETNKVSEVINR